MDLEEELNKKYENLSLEYGIFKQKTEELIPLVVSHFNDYLDEVINPALPKGYSIVKSTSASFSEGRFIIYTGVYKTPSGLNNGPLEIERIVIDLMQQYEKNNPWVDRISEGFNISK
ncbi:MAG: hypothetical protein Q7S33_02960 [Nanoarchaeota archaeon]|nr:hypothetical protein [Nanoarchaeota archaeon]